MLTFVTGGLINHIALPHATIQEKKAYCFVKNWIGNLKRNKEHH